MNLKHIFLTIAVIGDVIAGVMFLIWLVAVWAPEEIVGKLVGTGFVLLPISVILNLVGWAGYTETKDKVR